MTDYAKIALKGSYSTDSAYTNPIAETKFTDYTLTPDEIQRGKVEVDTDSTGAGALTIDLAEYSAVTAVLLWNRDATNRVRVECRSILGSANYTVTFTAGSPAQIADDDTNGTFRSNGAIVYGFVRVSDAADTTNNSAWPITAFTDTSTIKVTNLSEDGDTLLAEAADAVTLQFEGLVQADIPAGGFLIINNVVPEKDIILTATSAACMVEYFIVGS